MNTLVGLVEIESRANNNGKPERGQKIDTKKNK